ncbi:sigma-70 family RNA polymerase sigma factor [Neobittarella massiliensis]|uniref:RNA polymerase sigma factor rpoD n=1 Tax=uncultured Anaerotruncus sp. TaxID=905011 RepID=A0A1C6JHK4_9FIRM|nr:sigma-70 family RNA polymerase sigma factor [Neobittarella massiliensis]SCJ81596.1 RNA polymerase sigma factor rpoD [uncultured Anaerotruncus sp.]
MTETKQGRSNEELAILAQQGDKRALYQLWQQIETLVCMICGRAYQYRKDRADRAGVAEEDMKQEGYFAFLDAVQAYSPASGYRFTTYLHYPLQKRINALLGVRTVRMIKDPLCNCSSLDAPISGGDDENITVADTIPDKGTEMEEAEQRVFCDQLRADLEKCLDEIPDPEASALRAVYFDGNTLQQIAAQCGLSIERARQLKISGLRKMRYGPRLSRLKKYENEIISTQPWRGSGLGAYRVSGTSSVEKTVERLSGLWADGA